MCERCIIRTVLAWCGNQRQKSEDGILCMKAIHSGKHLRHRNIYMNTAYPEEALQSSALFNYHLQYFVLQGLGVRA